MLSVRWVFVALVLCILSPMAFAVGQKETAAKASGPVAVTYTSWEEGWEGPIAGKDEVLPEVNKRTGVDVTLKRWIVTSEEDRKRQLALWTSTDSMPEWTFVPSDPYTIDLMNQTGDAGKLWEIGSFVDQLKLDSATQAIEKLNNKFYSSQATGKSYVLSGGYWDPKWTQEVESAQEATLIRKDWLDKNGLGYPKTPDEYYAALKSFRDNIKTVNGKPVIPLVMNENLGGAKYLRAWFFDQADRDGRFRKASDGSYTNAPQIDKLERYVVFMNRLYREGLLDPEVGTIKDAQYQEKMTSGRVGSTGTPWWNMNSYNDAVQSLDPKALYVYFPIPKGEGVSKPVQQWVAPGASGAFVFSKKIPREKVEAAIKVLSYMSSVEGLTLALYGVQGKHWEYDKDKKLAYTKDFMDRTKGDWNAGAQIGVGYYSIGINQSLINSQKALTATDLRPDMIQSRKNLLGTIFTAFEPQDLVPPGPVESAKSSAITSAWNDLQFSAILAKSEAECRSLVKTWPAMWSKLGGDEIVKEKNELMKKAK